MDYWNQFYLLMDAWLMPLYRWPETPILGFLLGTAALAALCVIVGDATFNIAVMVNRRRLREVSAEVVRLNNLSIEALQAGAGDAYRGSNSQANEAFGKLFFLQAALSMAALWPLPFALAWMQPRFLEVEFPLFLAPSIQLGYIGPFLLLYILLRVLFGRVKGRLPFFRRSKEAFAVLADETGKLRSWFELLKVPAAARKNPGDDADKLIKTRCLTHPKEAREV